MANLFRSMAKAKLNPNVDTNSVSSQAASNEPKRPASLRHEHLNTNRSLTAPATMLSALIVGLGLILAQNFMYVALNGRVVSTISVSQSWISTISTGLAFAIKVALVIAVGAAYVQHQWVRLQQRSFKVSEIDALTAADSNLLYLFNSTVWLRYPVLAFMVLLTWTIPIGSTVTPGSLTIAPVQKFANHNTQVAQPQYDDFTNYGEAGVGGADGQLSENNTLTRLMAYTASSGMPVNLVPPFPNATYDLEFFGPVLRCSGANDTVVNNASIYYNEGNTGDQTLFAAWVGGQPNASYAVPQGGYPSLDSSSTDTSRIFVMTNTGTWADPPTANVTGNPDFNNNYTSAPILVNVTECDLWNATWNVHFNFQYPNQTRTVNIKSFTNPVAFMMNLVEDDGNGKTYDYASPTNVTNVQSYSAMMSAFGALLVGYAGASHYGTTSAQQTRYGLVDIDWTQAEAVERGLEGLFQNFTLSLLSNTGLTKNSSDAAQIPVNVETWPIQYVYHPLRLWLANGLALLATVICVCIGMHAFVHNDASYSNTFSTYVRAAHDTGLDMYINRADTGIWPPSKSFKQAQVSIGYKDSRSNTMRTNAMDDEPRSPEDRLLERPAAGQDIRYA